MSSAARQRVYRQRERDGKLVVPVELDESDVKLLVEAKVLDGRRDHHSREDLAQAVSNYLKISRYA